MPETNTPETNNNFQTKPVQQIPEQSNPGFASRPVEQPMFSGEMRDQLLRQNPSGTGFKGFYNANKWYIWGLVAGIIVISALAFFAFRHRPAQAPTEANVQVSIDVPAEVSSGKETGYRIVVENKDSQKLTDMQLELVYPEGVTYVDSRPVKAGNLSGTLFDIPDLVSGQNVAVFVTTRITGNVGDTKELIAKLHYRYSNFSSDFATESRARVRLLPSGVSLDISGPAQTNNAQLVSYKLHYRNTSDEEIKNARVTFNFGDGFSFGSSTPLPDLGSNTWNVSVLPKGGEGYIEVQGSFSSITPGESKIVTAEFLVLGPDGQYISQNKTDFSTAIASQPLVIMQSLENRQDGSIVVKPGDTLTYIVKYQNNAAVAASGANITATIDSKVLDLSTLSAEGGQVSGSTITWNAALVSALGSLLPGEGGSLRFSVQVKNPAVKDASKSLSVVTHVKIQSNEYETAFPGNDVTLKVSSPAAIKTGATFVSGEMPPKVGRTTSYRIALDLRNATNDFSNSFVTAFIPASFDVSSITPAEQKNVTFDQSTGKLTWNVGALPAHTGTLTPARRLEFVVRISPSASQANQSVLLLRGLTLDASDTYIGQAVHVEADNITTETVGDGSEGQVRE